MYSKYSDGLTSPFAFHDGTFLKSTIIFVVLTGMTAFPILVVILSSQDIGFLMLSILLLLITVTDYAITHILFIMKMNPVFLPSSVSHLVNHRFHPVCYFSVISIASVIYFSIGLIGAGYTGVAMTRVDWFEACFQLLGLVLISIALVFPASFPEANVKIIIKTEAGGNPTLPAGFDGSNTILGMTPDNWYGIKTVPTQAGQPPTQTGPPQEVIDSLRVFNISGNVSSILGTIVFLVGYFMEIAVVVAYLSMLSWSDIKETWWRIYIMTALILSGIFFVLFVITRGWKQLFSQLMAIFMIVMGVIMFSLGEGNLITTFGN